MLKASWIKGHLGLLSFLLMVVLAYAFFAVILSQRGPLFLHASNQEVNPVLASFQKNHRALVEINFSSLYGTNEQFQVLHPLLNMRSLKFREENPYCSEDQQISMERNKQLTQAFIDRLPRNSVDPDFPEKNHDFRKSMALELFSLKVKPLPDDFITSPPFLNEEGQSFAFELLNKGPAEYRQKAWVEQHLSFFSSSELSNILSKYKISNPIFEVISRLSNDEILHIVKADRAVMAKDYLFLKNETRLGFSPLSYWVYDIQDFKNDLKSTQFEVGPLAASGICLYKLGNTCWTYNSNQTMSYLYRYMVAIVGLVGVILLIVMGFFLRRLYEKEREQQKSRLALQVLSHEFRTPVSSLLLMIEQLSKSHSQFEAREQDLLMGVSSEVFKLQRIIEVSKNYLQTESHQVRFNHIIIPSINRWISDFASDLEYEVTYDLLKQDQSFPADPFWLKFSLTNLIQNAFAHGKPPVTIKLQCENGRVKISVVDQGNCEFRTLSEMTDAFVKSERSRGMGLGLNMTKFILDEWGVDFHYSNVPTSFTMTFPELRVK